LEAPPEKVEPLAVEQPAKQDEPVEPPAPEVSELAEVEPAEAPPLAEALEAMPTAEMPKVADIDQSAAPPEISTAEVAPEPPTKTAAAPDSEHVAKQQTPPTETGDEASTRMTPVAAQVAAALQATSPYSHRVTEGRLGLVEQQGGSGRTESSVALALKWLASVQSHDGRWDADEHGAGQEHLVLNQNRGGAGRNADTGVTALALLAFLGAGHSHMHGDYQDTVRNGIDFLIRSQGSNGSLFGDSTLYAQMYCHAMATFALAEAQAMTGDRRLEPAVLKAVNFSVAAQNTSVGGWRYRPGDSGDTSQLGWQMMALASAERAGIRIPSNTWQRVERFLGSVRRGTYGGLASYRPDSPASTSMTAEALYCRLLLDEVHGHRIDEAAAKEATANLIASPPTAERVNLYYWYYATLALHYRHAQNADAAEAWKTWNDAMTTAIVATQVEDGPHAGSWNTNTVWGGYGGRVYTTAMGAMCLEVYYRYAPVGEPGKWTAGRQAESGPR
jgi:hypothetical protein